MARRTPVDQLNTAIAGILAQYGDDVQANVGKIAEEMGKKGVQALKRNSKATFPRGTGKYAAGWKKKVEKDRLKTVVTIYNDHPALPHLLEYGHVTRNGTGRTFPRTPGHPHIKPVEEELVRAFEREVVDRL